VLITPPARAVLIRSTTMSDRTTSVVASQVQTPESSLVHDPRPVANGVVAMESLPTSPEQAPVQQPQPDSMGAALAGAPVALLEAALSAEEIKRAEEGAAKLQEQLQAEADATLKATVKAYRQGEKAYKQGLLEAGRLADQYVHQRMALGAKRAAAVQTLEGQLAMYSSSEVDIDRLIGCYQGYVLLAQGWLSGLEEGSKERKVVQVHAENVPYGHYRDAWRQLVQRVNKDTPQEHWVILPGIEAGAVGLFGKAAIDGLDKKAVQEQVKGLQREYMALEAERTKEREAVAKAAAAVDAEKAQQAVDAAVEAARVQQAAMQAVAVAKAEDRVALTAAAEAAKQELLLKQRAMAEAQAQADKRAREEKAAREAREAAEARERKALEQAQKQAGIPTAPKQAREPSQVAGGNLLKSAKHGTAKDVAEMAVELITGGDEPDSVLEEALKLLAHHPELSNVGREAALQP
jgi:hypothetical protein